MKLTEMKNLISSALQSLNQVQKALTTVQSKRINERQLNESVDLEYNKKMAICLAASLINTTNFSWLACDDNDITFSDDKLNLQLWGSYDETPDMETHYKTVFTESLHRLGFNITEYEVYIEPGDETVITIIANGQPNLVELNRQEKEIVELVRESKQNYDYPDENFDVLNFLNPSSKLAIKIDNLCRSIPGLNYLGWTIDNDDKTMSIHFNNIRIRQRDIEQLDRQINQLFVDLSLNIRVYVTRSYDDAVDFKASEGYDKLRRARKQA